MRLRAGEPVTVGTEEERKVLVRGTDGGLVFVPEAEADPAAYVIHEPGAADPSQAFALSRLDTADATHVPMGIFRQVERPSPTTTSCGPRSTARAMSRAARRPMPTSTRCCAGTTPGPSPDAAPCPICDTRYVGCGRFPPPAAHL